MSSSALRDHLRPALTFVTSLVVVMLGSVFVTGLALGVLWCLRAVITVITSIPTVYLTLCVVLVVPVCGFYAMDDESFPARPSFPACPFFSARPSEAAPKPPAPEQTSMLSGSSMSGSNMDHKPKRQPRRQPAYAARPRPVIEPWMSGPDPRSSYTDGPTVSTPRYSLPPYGSKAWTGRSTANSYAASSTPSTPRYSSSGYGSNLWAPRSTTSSYSRSSRSASLLAISSQPSVFRPGVKPTRPAQPARRWYEPPQYVDDLFAPAPAPAPAPSTSNSSPSEYWNTPSVSPSSSLTSVDQATLACPTPTALQPAAKTAGYVRPGSPSLVSPRDLKRRRVAVDHVSVAAKHIAGVDMDIDVPVSYAPEVDMFGPTAGDMDVDEVEMDWEREQVYKDVEMRSVFDDDVEMTASYWDGDEEMECAEMMMDWDAQVAY
ncbi:hypothetical protein FRC12_000204 [Ceratobasidium sp. 428]|nr:hypothetical protein FRC12_000204 [Ceratobasidium sp. 428]